MDVTLIVDGANVMGSRADGWWRDRAGAMARLHGELAALAAHGVTGPVPGGVAGPAGGAYGTGEAQETSPAGEAYATGEARETIPAGETGPAGVPAGGGRWFPRIVLVVEGRARAVLGLVEADPGVRVVAARGEGDDEIAGLAGTLPGPRIVITADRELRRRCEAAGAAVIGPGWLLRQFG
jgi:8-oxo-dGTP diphosphatase